jgi:hypothetical protein
MEWNHEEAAQESSRRGARKAGRSEAKKRANRENGRQGGLGKGRKKRIAARQNARRPRPGGASRKGERGDHFDSRPFRVTGYWLGLRRNLLFRPRTRLNPS